MANIVIRNFFHDYRLVVVKDYVTSGLALFYAGKAGFLLVQVLLWLIERRRMRHAKPIVPAIRKRFITGGLIVATFGMTLCLWSILYGRFNVQVHRQTVVLDNLPEAFDGFRIVQLSDLHAGSWYGYESRLKKIITLVDAQQADLIVFTGDFVNNFADEMPPIIPLLRQLRAPWGKFAILGNHDYGGYCRWSEPADSIANHIALLKNIAASGLQLLSNQSVILQKDSVSRIALIGVENWGVKKRQPKRADLAAAMKDAHGIPCKILLSHDPSYWPAFVSQRDDIALTLSGHTHGMQMGFRLCNRNYGPGDLLTRYWSGLYHSDHNQLYINTGLGVAAFLGRVGMPPEISVIELKCGDKP